MLSGDLSTMPLSDLLQWADTRQQPTLIIVRSRGHETWLIAESRVVTAGSPPQARGILATDGTPGRPGPGLRAVTREHLLDLFLRPNGTFEVRDDLQPPTPGVAVELPLQFLVMDGLRILDEWPRLQALYPEDSARLAATDAEPDGLDPIQKAIHELSLSAPALGEARLVLGLSRPVLLRRVHAMRSRGLVDVEGVPHGPDIEASVIDQARVLLRERQFREAAHVFRSLLASNPADPRLRRLLEESERMQCDALYDQFSATSVVSRAQDADDLAGAELAILDCLQRPRSVAVLVLASPLRELETLLSLSRLSARGVVSVESAD